MKRIFAREKHHNIVTPFPARGRIEIDPEPLGSLDDLSYSLRGSERADTARKAVGWHPNGGSSDEKQREMTSAALFSILHALDSCKALDLLPNREKATHQGYQWDKPAYFPAVGLEKGNKNQGVWEKGKGKEKDNSLAELKGAEETLTRTDYAAPDLMKRQSVLGTVTKTQLRVHQQEELPFSNLDRQESLPVFPPEPSSSSEKRSLSPEDIMSLLFQEYKVGKDNTQLLSNALAYVTPEQLEVEITRAFQKKCLASQALIQAQIPWASAVANRSRLAKDFQRNQDKAALEVTPQQKLVVALLQSNEALCEALKVYADLQPPTAGDDTETKYRSGLNNEESCPPSTVLDLGTSLLRVQTPPPSYEAPLDVPSSNHLPPPPSEDCADKVATDRTITNSSAHPSDNRERLTPPHSSHIQAVAHSQVLEESSQHPPTNLISALSVATESTTNPSRSVSPCSQSLPTVTSLPSPVAQNRALLPTDTRTVLIAPEDVALSKSLSTKVVPITEFPQNHHGCMQGDLSPVHKEVIIKVPDLTGKITREGDYPAGRGGFADVWKCVLRTQADESNVAVKVIQSHIHDQTLESKFAKRIRREILVWQRLSHENVLPLLGTVSHFGRYMSLVSPWIDNGSLMQYLQECGDDMSLMRRLQLAYEVASGLTYLHSSHVIHGDLTGTNVLVTDEGKACLCDFGLSSLMLEFYDTTFCTSTIGGNARWAAPEIYHITADNAVPSATTQSDVYSLGCIMLQILSGRVPYHYLPREGQVLLELQNGHRPRRPHEGHMSDILWDTINECWADNPADRPTSDNVARFLRCQFELEKSAWLH